MKAPLVIATIWLVLISAVCCTTETLTDSPGAAPASSNKSMYGLMFDAGSSGTRMFIYQWFGGRIPSVWGAPVFHPFNSTDYTYRVSPGISSFAKNREALDLYFEPFITYAIARIPPAYWHRTYMFLYATAGMRILPVQDQALILQRIRKIFYSWPFRFMDPNWARVISGVDEGVFGWMTTNYLLGTFQLQDPMATYGALDLGGASSQITFVPAVPLDPAHGGVQVVVGNQTYSLYSVSYLGLGVDQARLTKDSGLLNNTCNAALPCANVTDYCYPNGYSSSGTIWNGTQVPIYGGSSFTSCQTETDRVFPASTCPSCSIGSVFQPALRGKFYAMSAFVYALEVFGTPMNGSSIQDIQNAASVYCSKSLSQLTSEYPRISPSLLLTYCFTSTYQTSLLSLYGFDTTVRNEITYASSIGTTPLSWTLGAMVLAAEIVDSLTNL